MKHDLQFKEFKIDKVTEDSGQLTIEGWAAVFNNLDSGNDIILKGSFSKTLLTRKGRIAFCYQHDIYNPIGKILEIEEQDFGLFVKVSISASEDDIQTKLKEKILNEMSIGYRVIESKRGGGMGYEDANVISEIMLYEISIVTIAMNDKAIITGMKSEEKQTIIETEFERLIAIERNTQKKFELMKLKGQIKALMQEDQKQFTPTQDEPKQITPLIKPLSKKELFNYFKIY
jgi:HK97 family phage prohead protease